VKKIYPLAEGWANVKISTITDSLNS